MEKNFLQLWHWQLHNFRKAAALDHSMKKCASEYVEGFLSLSLSLCWLQREPEEPDAKIRWLKLFMCVPTIHWN